MRNFDLPDLPNRCEKPRTHGLTMVMDKGLSIRDAENLVEVSGDYIDFVKLGFGTSLLTPGLKEKISIYSSKGIRVYLGGTLFEAFLVRKSIDLYLKVISELGINTVEVSDGSLNIAHEYKCDLIRQLKNQGLMVLSEVGSKEEGIIIHPTKWISMMKKEIEAGSSYVIAEARESGNVGIYHSNGKTHVLLVDKIVSKVDPRKILWESPQKPQQVWFIKSLGSDVNLGNISPADVIPLETLRLGLRGDTFFTFIGQDKQKLIK